MKRLTVLFVVAILVLFATGSQRVVAQETIVIYGPGDYKSLARYVFGCDLELDAPIRFLSGASGSFVDNPDSFSIRLKSGLPLATVPTPLIIQADSLTVRGVRIQGPFCNSAIRLEGSDNLLEWNYISDCYNGILSKGNSNRIFNNRITVIDGNGIFLYGTKGDSVFSNHIIVNGYSGIYLGFNASNNYIFNNVVNAKYIAMDLNQNCNENEISHNIFDGHEYAIYVNNSMFNYGDINWVTQGNCAHTHDDGNEINWVFLATSIGVVVDNFDQEITKYALWQNYPNPFNPETTISFFLPKSEFVSLEIYNLLGKKVKTLVNGELSQGNHSVIFNGTKFPSGVYFYKLVTEDGFVKTKKMTLLK